MPSNPEMDRATLSDAEVAKLIRENVASGGPEDDAMLLRQYPATADNIRTGYHYARAQWEQERGTALSDAEVAALIRRIYHAEEGDDKQVVAYWAAAAELVRAAYARGQSPAPDVRALQREAASKALIAFRDHRWADENASNCVEWRCLEAFSDRYLAATYPADPAPPSVTPEPTYLWRDGPVNVEEYVHQESGCVVGGVTQIRAESFTAWLSKGGEIGLYVGLEFAKSALASRLAASHGGRDAR